LIPLYLLHVTAVPHNESPSLLWSLVICNIFVVTAGIIFMYKLFTLKNILKSGITFGVAILVNYLLIAIYGSIFDLLG
jgi:cytochrome b subunit of formate dehydrogenase